MATKKMNAAVVEHFGKPLVLREWDIPTPGVGQVVVKTEACGVCHTDLHAADGDWPVKPTLPFIPGHEAVGLVSAVGAGVIIVKEGDRVGVPWLYSACGHCEYCLSAWETVCAEAQFGGYTKNGGFAEYVLADPNYVAHISRKAWRPPRLHHSFAPASRPTRESSRRRRSQVNGSQFPVAAASDILAFNMPRRRVCWCARSTSTTANWRTRKNSGPISSSTRSMRIREQQ